MGHTNKIIKGIADTAGKLLPDKMYLSIRYRMSFNRSINWRNPQTYNEKIQWMKLYDRNPLYTKLVDKYEVRSFVKEKLGEEYLIPCLGVWNRFEDIDFSNLPNQFVLKCTHDSGSVMIVRDKKAFNVVEASKHFASCLARDCYHGGREWAYKDVKPRIIAEEFMIDDSGIGLKDYKFFCFDGVMRSMFIATDRGVEGTDVKFDFFDKDFNHLPFRHGHENAAMTPKKPDGYEEMISIAEKLSQGLRHVRVDLYNINGKIYFGELTFYHHCGFVPFDPEDWDYTFGNWIKIG